MPARVYPLVVASLFCVLLLWPPAPAPAQAGMPPAIRPDADPVGALAAGPSVKGLTFAAPSTPAAGSYITIPGDFPGITVTVPAKATEPGLVFASTFHWFSPGSAYLLILDNAGEPVFYQKLPAGDQAVDFKVLPSGRLSYFDGLRNAFVIMDSSYREVGTVIPGNGRRWLDGHELLELPNGHFLLMANAYDTMDLSLLVPGGNPQAQVMQQIVQEVDMAGNVFFDWPILQYVPITDTSEPLTAATIDYSHCNALEADSDGNVLMSCRHLDSVIKINRRTRAIMWHLGGAHNDFTFSLANGVAGPAFFYHQHDIRRLPNGHISLFDNHNDHTPAVSRVLEYALDEQQKQATLVRALQNTPPVYTGAMGNGQLLSGGDTFVGWGSNPTPSFTEFHADGSKAFEVDFNDPLVSYRAYRFPWTGRPTWPPALITGAAGTGIQLTFSWNGATDVASYDLYGGNTLPPDQALGRQAKAGFETSVQLDGAQAGYCFYQVVPIDGQGMAGPGSQVALNVARGDPACFHQVFLPWVSKP